MSFNSASLGAGLVVLSSLFYAGYGIWAKLIGDYQGVFTITTMRCLFTAVLFAVIILYFKQSQPIQWRRDAKWLGLSLVSSIFCGAPLYYATLHAGVGIALAIFFVSMVLGMFFLGWLVDRERYTVDKWISTTLGVTGLLMVLSPSMATVGWLALAASVASGFATALNVVASKKMPYNATQSAMIVWTLGVIANAPFIFIFAEGMPTIGWDIELVYLALFATSSVVASWSVIQGVKLIEAGAAGILGLLEIVFGVFFGMVLFGERPGVLALVGVAVIIAASAFPYLKDYNAKRGTLEA